MRGLYAIVDTDALSPRGLDPVAFAEAILGERPAAIQLRAKRCGAGQTLALLRAIAPLARRAGVPLFANDRPDLAVLASCDGVHVGQDDLPAAAARALGDRAGAPLRVGLSTHTRAQLEAALAEPPGALDYIAVGPIFPTASKDRPDPVVGLDELGALSALAARARPGLPLVAIGGVTLETAGAVGARCACAAVIAALLPAGGQQGPAALAEVAARARALHDAILAPGLLDGGAP